jgi:hypothetical protein
MDIPRENTLARAVREEFVPAVLAARSPEK